MWIVKYQPKTLAECVMSHLDNTVRIHLEFLARQDHLSNILFFGPPGTGKSTFARILANKDRYAVMSFNAADFSSADIDTISKSRQTNPLFNQARCVVIDEFDSLSKPHQTKIRSLLDDDRSSISWILTCNDIEKVDKALKSRLIKVECSRATDQLLNQQIAEIVQRCHQILDCEKIRVTDEEVQRLVEQHYPDIRETITALEIQYSSKRTN